MIKNFPFLEDKIKVIKNMVSPELINKMAEGEAVEMASSECDTENSYSMSFDLSEKY